MCVCIVVVCEDGKRRNKSGMRGMVFYEIVRN